jgi:hypothetical protein
VGAQLVVGLLEGIEDALLQIEVRGRGPSGAGLEGLVQALVGPVFLGAAGRDALVGDPELEPPDVEAVSPWMPVEANGAPLSLRIASGRPPVRKSWRRWAFTPAPATSRSPWQPSK